MSIWYDLFNAVEEVNRNPIINTHEWTRNKNQCFAEITTSNDNSRTQETDLFYCKKMQKYPLMILYSKIHTTLTGPSALIQGHYIYISVFSPEKILYVKTKQNVLYKILKLN